MLGDSQGTDASSMSNETLASNLGSGWEIRDGQVVPKMADNIVNPVFSNVLISDATANVSTTYVDFIGNFSSVTLAGGDKSVLYLGTNNQLYYPAANRTINACRAYFQLNLSDGEDVKAFVLSFDEDDADAISRPTPDPSRNGGEAWYDLNGRKLSGKPTHAGVYIYNGKKQIIK